MDSESAGTTKGADARRISELLRDLMNVFRARFEEEFRDTGVTLAQLRLLKAVQAQTERSAASIARDCHVTPQTLHTMLTRAVREGWITRGNSDRNHRFVTVALTPAGKALLQHGIELKERTESELWRGVSAEAVHAARRTLEAGLRNLEAKANEPPGSTPHPNA